MENINAVGRRKASVVRVYLKQGSGTITCNGKEYKDYFSMVHQQQTVVEPLEALELTGSYDVNMNAAGGGVKGQAEAARLAIARALVKIDPENKAKLKAINPDMFTRDARVVERKKPGLKKARKATQYRKR